MGILCFPSDFQCDKLPPCGELQLQLLSMRRSVVSLLYLDAENLPEKLGEWDFSLCDVATLYSGWVTYHSCLSLDQF